MTALISSFPKLDYYSPKSCFSFISYYHTTPRTREGNFHYLLRKSEGSTRRHRNQAPAMQVGGLSLPLPGHHGGGTAGVTPDTVMEPHLQSQACSEAGTRTCSQAHTLGLLDGEDCAEAQSIRQFPFPLLFRVSQQRMMPQVRETLIQVHPEKYFAGARKPAITFSVCWLESLELLNHE